MNTDFLAGYVVSAAVCLAAALFLGWSARVQARQGPPPTREGPADDGPF